MEFAKRTELRIRRQANETMRSVHIKTRKPKTFTDGARPWAPLPVQEKSHSQNNPSDLLDRGCISRRKNLTRSRGDAEDVRKYGVRRLAVAFTRKTFRIPKNVFRANNVRTINYSNVIGTNNYYRVSLRY